MNINKEYLLSKQYQTAENFQVRVDIHRYGTNPEPFWPWVINQYPLKVGDKVLEVGCGPGGFWQAIYQNIPDDCEILLTDFSQEMLGTAKRNLTGLTTKFEPKFEMADVENLLYPGKSFDAVLAHYMLYHAASPTRALKEITRVLKDTGFCGIMLPSENNMQELFTLVECENPLQAVSFSAEKAENSLSALFKNVQKYCYQNTLEVTEVEPLLRYLRSLSRMEERNEAFYEKAKAILSNHIKKEGCLCLPTTQYLFVGCK